MNAFFQSLARPAFGLLLVSSVATAAVATSARPADAGVVVSIGIGIGGGYAPAYPPPYPPRYVYFRHRHYVPAVWGGPVFYPSYGRPYFPRYGYGYGYRYGRPYDYGRGYGYGHGYRYGADRGRAYFGRR